MSTLVHMQRGFTKLFNTIVTSTIWQEDDKTRIVWITMLAIADSFGNVFAAIPGLASVANVSIEAAENAVKNLMSPDPYSRTKDFEGRRIEEIDGGWHILNHGKYRKMMDEEERREYKTRWAREKRRQTRTEVDKSRPSGHIASASASVSFLEELKRNPFNSGVDIDLELDKAKRWCKQKGRRCTQRFFQKWVERADRVVPDPPKKTNIIIQPKPAPDTPEEMERRKLELSEQMKQLREKFKMPC